jgi:hypothetical protein
VTTLPASAFDVHEQVWTLLDATPDVNTYDSEVPKTPPLDIDGRVHAYAVLFVSPGRPTALMLDGTQDSLSTSFQVTCVGGDQARALWCVDQVRAQLVGAFVEINGRQHQITASETQPGPVRRDDDVTPPRHFVAELFDLFIP